MAKMSYRTTRLWGILYAHPIIPQTRSGSGSPLRRLLIRGSLHPIIVDQLSRPLDAECVRMCSFLSSTNYRKSFHPSIKLYIIPLLPCL
jgi:hypothetical protein